MKSKLFWFSILCFAGIFVSQAQQTKNLSLEEAVEMALKNSDAAKISESKITTAENELSVTKNKQYPDFKVSGQYKYLTNADVTLKTSQTETNPDPDQAQTQSTPDVNQLLLGQADLSMPLFAGFKLKNAVKASENLFRAASLNAENDKEEVALKTLKSYIALYKAEKTVGLVKENLKSAERRVKDFKDMEENGLLARNDLLKAKLQKSNVELTLAEAKKDKRLLNYQLITFLKLPKNTKIEVDESRFGLTPEADTLNLKSSRADLEALTYQEKAAEDQIKMTKGNYYPTLALSGGYLALDLQNALTVKNAMNIGVGISYDLTSIFKNKSNVRVAESKAEELKHALNQLEDQVSIEVESAREEYQLVLRNFKVYTESEEQATENYRIVKDKYDNGLQDTSDLLEADVQQLQAKINLAYAKANITQKYYELQKAQGKLINKLNNNNRN